MRDKFSQQFISERAFIIRLRSCVHNVSIKALTATNPVTRANTMILATEMPTIPPVSMGHFPQSVGHVEQLSSSTSHTSFPQAAINRRGAV